MYFCNEVNYSKRGSVCQGKLKNDKIVIYYSFVIIIDRLKSGCYNIDKGGGITKKFLWLFAVLWLMVCLVGYQSESSEATHDDVENGTTTTTANQSSSEFPEYFAAVLEDKQTFAYDGKSIVLSQLLSDYQDGIGRYALVDMDADKLFEMVLEFDSQNFILVLHKDNDAYYGYLSTFRSMYQLNTDGSFYWNNSASNYGCSRIQFNGDKCEETELWRMERGEEGSYAYYVEGKEVSKEYFDSVTEEEKEKVVWVEYTDKYKTITISQEMNHDELAKIVAKNLGVPVELDFTYEISERFYWEAGEIWFRNVVIHVEDGVSARASVDPTNGDLLRGILNYEKLE